MCAIKIILIQFLIFLDFLHFNLIEIFLIEYYEISKSENINVK